MSTRIKVDYDGPPPRNLDLRLRMVAEFLAWDLLRLETRRTRRGTHLDILIRQDWPPVVVVAVQAILGSDWARETYNLVRAVQLDAAPTFWRERANVLYRAKSKEQGK